MYDRELPVSAFPWGDQQQPEPPSDQAFATQWLKKTKEVIDKYKPDLLWFDFWLCYLSESYWVEMLHYYYNQAAQRNQPVVLTYKPTIGPEELKAGTATVDLESSRMANIYPSPWLTDISITQRGWSFTQDTTYRTTSRLVHLLVDIVSKNGCMLLNIVPEASGIIPVQQQHTLLEIGTWLEVNGEAIYGIHHWVVFGEGPPKAEGEDFFNPSEGFSDRDIRFTTNGDVLYAIVLGQPESPIRIHSMLAEPILNIRLLGSDEQLEWRHDRDAIENHPPSTLPCEHAVTFRIQLQ